MAFLDAQAISKAVIDSMAQTKDPRFLDIMTGLVKHLHAFAQEVDLRPEEWGNAIDFLTKTGQMCDDKRQEFIILSDTLGLSMLVVAMDQKRNALALQHNPPKVAPTEATVQGPFFVEAAPKMPMGSDLAAVIEHAQPAYYHGTITDTSGQPVANCLLDVWSSDEEGFYDVQKGEAAPQQLRAQFRTGPDGNYHFWSLKPALYPVPMDGTGGVMLRAMGRTPYRPGHMHTMLTAPGHVKLVTHLFDAESEYLDSDAVFGVRESLIVNFEQQAPGKAPDGRMLDKPWLSCAFDFCLVPQNQSGTASGAALPSH